MQLSLKNKVCPWDHFDDKLDGLTRACCPNGNCGNKLPNTCTFDCGRRLSVLMKDCGGLFKSLLVGDTGNVRAIEPYQKFLKACLKLDPRSLAMAAYTAQCAECGNSKLEREPWGEECDNGPVSPLPLLPSLRPCHPAAPLPCRSSGGLFLRARFYALYALRP